MPDQKQPDLRSIPDDEARRLLKRAAELDSAQRGNLSVDQLRQAAREAGIRPDAFDSALASSPATNAPWWVRHCLFGVPDRRAAMVYYWVFVAMLFVAPLLTLDMVPGLRISKLKALAILGFCMFALWSTSQAVRWLDEHGWDKLNPRKS